jgi:hypothetical protein
MSYFRRLRVNVESKDRQSATPTIPAGMIKSGAQTNGRKNIPYQAMPVKTKSNQAHQGTGSRFIPRRVRP